MAKSININLHSGRTNTIPFSFGDLKNSNAVILAGDIGGTKTNLSLFKLEKGVLNTLKESSFTTDKYSSFSQIFSEFHDSSSQKIDSMCLGVAGPVIEGRVSGTNFSWVIDATELQQELGIRKVSLINDLKANAYGLAALDDQDLREIKSGSAIPGNCSIISPGTGLGEAGLYWDGKVYYPFGSEGGHCDFSPTTDLDVDLWRFLKQQFGSVSWERLLSGSGIVNIYKFLVHHRKVQEPEWLKEEMAKEDPAAVISRCAKDGNFPVCRETIDLFLRYLATETAQMALKFKSTGGIFIGGGILPKIESLLNKESFVDQFLQNEKMKPLLEKIPINLILNAHTPKYGTALYAAMKLEE